MCTSLLPDILLTVLVANEQNIEGTKYIINRARTVHSRIPRDRTKLIVLPILGRDESYTEYELSSSWRRRLGQELEFTFADWLPKSIDADTFLQKIFIPYYSYCSFGENLPVVKRENELQNPTSISAAYGRIASLIENDLDWAALEQGVNTPEIELLRLKASRGEAKSEEYAKAYAINTQRQKLVISGPVVAALIMGAVFASSVMYFKYRTIDLELQAKTAEPQATESNSEEIRKALEADLASSKKLVEEARADTKRIQQQFDEMKLKDEAQKRALEAQINQLQQQNRSLLSVLERSNAQTQQKLDELITRSR